MQDTKKGVAAAFDRTASVVIPIVGLIYLLIFMWLLYERYQFAAVHFRYLLQEKYLDTTFFVPISIETAFVLSVQLLWKRKWWNLIWLRMLIALLQLVSLEALMDWITPARQYLPSSWGISFYDRILELCIDTATFLGLTVLIHVLFNRFRQRPRNSGN